MVFRGGHVLGARASCPGRRGRGSLWVVVWGLCVLPPYGSYLVPHPLQSVMARRSPESLVESLCALLAEHGIHAVLVFPSTTKGGREYLRLIMINYTEPEAVAVLKDAVHIGETSAQAESADASE